VAILLNLVKYTIIIYGQHIRIFTTSVVSGDTSQEMRLNHLCPLSSRLDSGRSLGLHSAVYFKPW